MAPLEKDRDGLWGEVTATIDWCEANYEVTFYMSEFWNTISNVFMIIPPILALALAHRDKFEDRVIWSQLSLLVIGVGSWCFHMTLLYHMQLFDELPMIWGSAFMLYSIIEVDGKPHSRNTLLQVVLIIYCLTVTVTYILVKNPIFHEVAYGIMVVCMVIGALRVIRKYQFRGSLFYTSVALYGLGFIIWNTENIMCPQIRQLRAHLPRHVRPLTQLHAWWHLFAGLGTYLGLVFCAHMRAVYLKKNVHVKMGLGILPYLRQYDYVA